MQASVTLGRGRKALSNLTMLCFVCWAAVLLAGCGGSSQKVSTIRARPTQSTAPGASTVPGGIRGRALLSNELAGFVSTGVAVYPSAQTWLSNANDQQPPAQATAEKAMLTREGFKAGAVENLTGPAPDQGLSIVEQFRSPTAARAALAFYISQQKEPKVQSTDGAFAAFKVSGVLGAVGYTLGGSGANIAFAQGDYYYLVGREGGSRANIAGLSAAARHLYQRVRG